MGNKYWLVAVLVAWGKYGWLSSIRRTTCLPLKRCPVYAHTDTGKDTQTQTHLHHLPTPQEHKGTHKYIHKNTRTTYLPLKTHKYIHLPTTQGHTGTGKDTETQLHTQTHTNINADTCNTCLPLKHSSQAHRQIQRQTQTHVPAAYPQSQANRHRQRHRHKQTHTYIITDKRWLIQI